MEVKKVKISQHPLSRNKISSVALRCINDFICSFQNSSRLLYLYEADVQADLLINMRNNIPPVCFSEIESKNINIENIFKLNLINQEYPVRKRFDVVCIDPFMIENYVDWMTNKGQKFKPINHIFWELPLLFAVELKFSFYGEGTKTEGILNDFSKLIDYKINNYHIDRNKDLAPMQFPDCFRFISLGFYHEQSIFEKAKIELLKKNFFIFRTKRISEWNCIYLVSANDIVGFKRFDTVFGKDKDFS